MPNTAPSVTITAPDDGASAASGALVAFAATAVDAEEGDLGAGLSWASSLEGALGTGASLSTGSVSAGEHVITAVVVDGGGLSGSDSVSFTVVPVATNTAPAVAITSPQDGATFAAGDSTSFAGTATDAEDGDLGAALSWSSDLDGARSAPARPSQPMR